jgi:hypothetical protein
MRSKRLLFREAFRELPTFGPAIRTQEHIPNQFARMLLLIRSRDFGIPARSRI